MKVTLKMKETKNGSEDGRFTKSFVAGEVYHVEESLAQIFLKQDWAETFDKELPKKEELNEEEDDKEQEESEGDTETGDKEEPKKQKLRQKPKNRKK